jgi:hypothetical protein
MQFYRRLSADASGRFDIDGLSPGKYWVSSEPSEKEAAALMKAQGERDLEAAYRLQRRASADVAEGETTQVIVGGLPREGVRVHGTITAAGQPIAGCLLTVFRLDGGGSAPQSSATDAQGRYELIVEGAGNYGFSLHDRKSGISFSIS